MGMLQDYDDGSADQVNIEKFLGRIDREINKYALIQRFYLLIQKRCEGKSPEFEDIFNFLEANGMGVDGLNVKSFQQILFELELIGPKNENWDYFAEDFDPENEGYVQMETFESDKQQIYAHIEELIYSVFSMMDAYCKDEYQKRSLKDELSMFQRDN